ncbi:hypothetical protein IAQ61_004232 [Plenodomus lingam]|uniref:uncharacterized protein n=1 Tax=Leptosphaeria maculans TaxID=5022 RepID=UPI003333C8F5|nr:hypothetical protein IAQ61_004232 [Plenodomus lingam]
MSYYYRYRPAPPWSGATRNNFPLTSLSNQTVSWRNSHQITPNHAAPVRSTTVLKDLDFCIYCTLCSVRNSSVGWALDDRF